MPLTTKDFKAILKKNKDWLTRFEALRAYPAGFSFDPNRKWRPSKGEKGKVEPLRPEEIPEWYSCESDVSQLHMDYVKRFAEYLEIGQEFHDAVTNDKNFPLESESLMLLSESYGHFLHNAAVLWLEKPSETIKPDKIPISVEPLGKQGNKAPNTIRQINRLGYLDCLQGLWLSQFLKLDSTTPRDKAFIEYGKSHTTLGKVIVANTKSQFHKDKSIRAHPSFWGLFMISPTNANDKGTYDIGDAKWDKEWVEEQFTVYAGEKEPKTLNALQKQAEATKEKINSTNVQWKLKQLNEDLSRTKGRIQALGKNDIYESLPRRFGDSDKTPDGVYLHRSKAHGRDDFLVYARGAGKDRRCAVWCTKGVGADPRRVPGDTAKKLNCAQSFCDDWEAGKRTDLPFTCPDPGADVKEMSWRRFGYCVAWGGEHDEIATVDFHNFLTMYRFVSEKLGNRSQFFAHLSKVFVEPYACIEISCIEANRKRLGAVEKAVKAGESGYPVQVVTGAPCETSLRMYKRGHQQDYDYGWLDLELVEWERVHGGVPTSKNVDETLEREAKRLAESMGMEKSELKLRMLCAFRCLSLMLASYVAFLENGWATDTNTGAFSGRNFGGGPRDANEWGPLTRLCTGTNGKPIKNTVCASVDLRDLGTTIKIDLLLVFGLPGLKSQDNLLQEMTFELGSLFKEEDGKQKDLLAYLRKMAEDLKKKSTKNPLLQELCDIFKKPS